MTTKLIQIGNSLGLIIPREELEANKLQKGSEVQVKINGAAVEIGGGRSSITPEFMKTLDGVNKRYGKALKELADK